MDCERCQGAFAAAVEGLLDPANQRPFAAHLGDCPACAADYDETCRLVARLQAQAARGGAVPPLADRVEGRIIRAQALQLRKVAIMRRRILRLSAAAALLAAAGLVGSVFWSPGGRRVHADDIKAADRAIEGIKTATWRVSYYVRFDERGGNRSRWLRDKNNEQRLYFKAPGRYRREDIDEAGNIQYVSIEDAFLKVKVDINYPEKTAERVFLTDSIYTPLGPFATFRNVLRENRMQSLGGRRQGDRELEGFRFVETAANVDVAGQPWSYDFWVDARTKRLAIEQVPGADLFPPADIFAGKLYDVEAKDCNMATIDGTPFVKSVGRGMGGRAYIMQDIAVNVPLGDDLFGMAPPAGFPVRETPVPTITEADVTNFLGLSAGYFGGTFPDDIMHPMHGPEYLRFERIEHDWGIKKPDAGTPGEIAYIEAMHHWWRQGIPGPGPLNVFAYHLIEPGSWKYLGGGAKLGDKDRTICWYRPVGSNNYHVVAGDLSVREVAPADLPLPVAR